MLKRNLFFLFTVTIFALLSLILCVNNYNPYTSNLYQFAYFYGSVLVTIAGILALAIFYFRIVFNKKETIFVHFWPAVRQGMIVSLGLTTLLALLGLKLLDVWVGAPVMIIILLLELFFQTKKFKLTKK